MCLPSGSSCKSSQRNNSSVRSLTLYSYAVSLFYGPKFLSMGDDTVRPPKNTPSYVAQQEFESRYKLQANEIPLLVLVRTKSEQVDVTSSELFLFAKNASEDEVIKLMDRILEQDLSSREVEALRKKAQDKPARKPKEVSRQYKIRNGNAQIGFIKEWDSGKVAFEVRLLDQRDRDALVEELKKRFTLSEVDTDN